MHLLCVLSLSKAATAARAAAACVTAGEAAGVLSRTSSARDSFEFLDRQHANIRGELDTEIFQTKISRRLSSEHMWDFHSIRGGSNMFTGEDLHIGHGICHSNPRRFSNGGSRCNTSVDREDGEDSQCGGEDDCSELIEVDVAAVVGHRFKQASSNPPSETRNSFLVFDGNIEVQYRVRWKGFTAADDEWVDRHELADAEEPAPSLLHDYERKHKLGAVSSRSHHGGSSRGSGTAKNSSHGACEGNINNSLDGEDGEQTLDQYRYCEKYSTPIANVPVTFFSPPPETSPPPPPPDTPSSIVVPAPPPSSPPPPLPPTASSFSVESESANTVGRGLCSNSSWWRGMATGSVDSTTPKNLEKHGVDAGNAGCSAEFCRQQ
jgi:hypothetical protein